MRDKTIQSKHITDAEIIACIDAGGYPDEMLADKYPAKVILQKMERMVDRGILNYGVSLRTAWVEKRPD